MSEITSNNNFIHDIIDADIAAGGRYEGKTVYTRFPPEPNGYLHIGHAKAICVDFGTAEKYGGKCNLRFDDTNPTKEDTEYVDAIKNDVSWLGFKWEKVLFASEYFPRMYECAVRLIKEGLAYVDNLTAEEMKEYRGTLTEPGKNSPYRDRAVSENLELFEKMKNGEFNEGECILRAKIDMASPNMNMRDPAIYRIVKAHHHKTGNEWCIYPMYDFAHPLEDAFEGITHSLCDVGFKDHRPLYDWVVEKCGPFDPQPCQNEFARLNLTYTVMSKRYLRNLVETGVVSGWDDPRMPTLCGLRRRGYTPGSIRKFIETVGVSTSNSTVDYALLEYCIREDLKMTAPRGMAVLNPIKLVIDNYPEDLIEEFDAEVNPENPEMGNRKVAFSKELYIERDDFMIEPVKGYFRLFPGNEVRLKYAYYAKCVSYETDDDGNVTVVHCTYDPESKGGWLEGRKVKGTIHWVSAHDAVPATVNLYEQLFADENPMDDSDGRTYLEKLNPDSLKVCENAFVEPYLAKFPKNSHFQFLRNGFFSTDDDHTAEKPVFNRTVSLKDGFKGGKK
ncbi:MAG: glutamine--tRNA ligase/YqeY domain fusion protein [Ruminococcaceae bacterium]|nr:glutamine--tRNA ligase/YqeY domain fusion protein [Oscillospiraceae bacterium]